MQHDTADSCRIGDIKFFWLNQASEFANLLWALAASNQLQSDSVAPLLASMGELPVDGFNAAALKQLAMVRAALPDPGIFAQHVPHALQQAVDQASQPLRGMDLYKVRDLAECAITSVLFHGVCCCICAALHFSRCLCRMQESVCNEVSALLTVMNVQHSTGQSIAQGALTIDVVVLSQQVWLWALAKQDMHLQCESACWVGMEEDVICGLPGAGSGLPSHAHLVPQVAMKLDGPGQFFSNPPYLPLGDTLLEWRLLLSTNFKVKLCESVVFGVCCIHGSAWCHQCHTYAAERQWRGNPIPCAAGGVGTFLHLASSRQPGGQTGLSGAPAEPGH